MATTSSLTGSTLRVQAEPLVGVSPPKTQPLWRFALIGLGPLWRYSDCWSRSSSI